jgi:DNA-binding GntR family transcriptional regulator
MQYESAFERRPNISEDVANCVRALIVDGGLSPGDRINEVQLSRELGVSRTPLREAIARLVREGTLIAVPRIGSFVKPLTVDEFKQIYPIRALLDPEALRFAGIPAKPQIDQLERLNRRIARATTPDDIISLDDEWHLLLIRHCPNEALLQLIGDFMRRTRRYELALMRDQKNVSAATHEHETIIEALRAGNLEQAVGGLRQNLRSGVGPILEWLQRREQHNNE